MKIQILGSGCANCKTTYQLVEQIAHTKGVAIELEKVEEIGAIMSYGVLSTPGVVIDGRVVHAGGVPSRALVEQWLTPTAGGCCSGGACCG